MGIKSVGLYKELVHNGSGEPSIHDAVQSAKGPIEDTIIAYLESGHVYIGVPDIVVDVLKPERPLIGSSSIRTDGSGVWPDYLAYFVREYHLELDAEFVEHIQERNGEIVPESKIDWAYLDQYCIQDGTNNDAL